MLELNLFVYLIVIISTNHTKVTFFSSQVSLINLKGIGNRSNWLTQYNFRIVQPEVLYIEPRARTPLNLLKVVLLSLLTAIVVNNRMGYEDSHPTDYFANWLQYWNLYYGWLILLLIRELLSRSHSPNIWVWYFKLSGGGLLFAYYSWLNHGTLVYIDIWVHIFNISCFL